MRRQLLGLAIAAIGGLLILVGGCVLLWGLKQGDAMARIQTDHQAGIFGRVGTGLRSWLAEFF